MLQFIPRTKTDSESAAISLYHDTGLPLALCRLLCQRGITDKISCDKFLNVTADSLYSPFLFLDMEKAKSRIEKALSNHEKICIYGDYDVDGVCATSILLLYLRYRGADVFYRIPSRQKEGYGMNENAVNEIAQKGTKLVITVDNGVVAHKEIALCYEKGMEVIITDHHHCTDTLPECCAVICHTRPDNTYPNTSLCGAGTALKIVEALGGKDAMLRFIPFAGLATVADVVPLQGENRTIVSLALKMINSDDCPIGIKSLIDMAKPNAKTVTERDFAFALSPRLNAAGRLYDASEGVELLCAETSDIGMKIATNLERYNAERRSGENLIVDEAIAQIKNIDLSETRILILASENWNPGIVGIAASRIAEKYCRPTILLAKMDNILTGSARSVNDIDIYDIMVQFRDMYIKFGGHALAAGVTLPFEMLDEYRQKANEYVCNKYDHTYFIPKQIYDSEIKIEDLTPEFIETAKLLAPFGEGNPEPRYVCRNVKLMGLKRIGAELNHLSGRISQNGRYCDIVAFERGRDFDTLINMDMCDILCVPILNEWSKQTKIQLRISEFSQSGISSPEKYFMLRKDNYMKSFTRNIRLVSDTDSQLHTISDDEVKNIFSSSCDGTLLLCSDVESSVYCEKLLCGIMHDSTFCDIHSSCPYNSVVHAPDIANIHGSYHRIILAGAYSRNMTGYIKEHFPKCEIYMLYRPHECEEAEYLKSKCDRHIMGIFYKGIDMLTKNGDFRTNVIEYLSKEYGEKDYICEFALDVFIETGLFFEDKNAKIIQYTEKKRVDLFNSKTYCNAMAFTDCIV